MASKAISSWVYGEGEAPAEPTWANAAANAVLRFGRSLTLPLCGSAGASPSLSDAIHSRRNRFSDPSLPVQT